MSRDEAREAVQEWMERVVMGLNLCPFAKPEARAGRIRIVCCEGSSWAAMRRFVLHEMLHLWETPAQDVSTTLLVFPDSLHRFDDYLDFLALANDWLAQAGLEGVFQIASFHPAYCFEGVGQEERSHYTNRSPLPVLHLLREDDISRAIEGPLDTEAIPAHNIERLQQLSDAEWRELFGDL